MKWVDRLLRRRRAILPEEDPERVTVELRLASEQRRDAERKLEQTHVEGREVRDVSLQARRLRTANNFSARWDAALRKPRDG